MQFNEVNWTPVFIALAIGTIAGVIMVIASLRRKGTAVSEETLQRRDLEGERDAIVAQLQELDDTGMKASGEELGRIRYEMELKLASVLRDLERETAIAASPAARQIEPRAEDEEVTTADPLATVKGFLWGIAGTAAVAALVVFVLQTSEPKEQPQPSGAAMGAQQDAELAQIESAVRADPENLDLQVELARAYLMRNQMEAVASITNAVLKKSPDHPRALSYAALVQLQLGQHDRSIQMLNTALSRDPQLMDGWIHLAIVYAESGHMEEARSTIEAAKQKRPDQAAMLDSLWQQIVNQPAQRAKADPAQSVEGTVEMKPGASKPSPNAAIFLIARDSSAPSGPPVAVKKMSAADFPMAFHLDAGDSMMGQPLPQKMTIEARVDVDGNPMASNNEPSARVDNVALGSSGIQLVLQ